MDLAAFDALAQQHRKSLEQRFRRASTMHTNLTRMINEAIKTIDERAEKDRAEISQLFFTLIENQNQEIALLRGELGISDKPEEQQIEYDDYDEELSVASVKKPKLKKA